MPIFMSNVQYRLYLNFVSIFWVKKCNLYVSINSMLTSHVIFASLEIYGNCQQ